MKFKVFIVLMILSFINSHIVAQTNEEELSGDALIYEFKEKQIVDFKLNNGESVIINYITKTNEFIVGYKVKVDMGNFVTQKEKILIPYEKIESYKIIFHERTREKIIVIGLVAGLIAMAIITISVAKAIGEGINSID